MPWTDVSQNSSTWEQGIGTTTWDGGATEWDISGNVAMTYWDIETDAWTETSQNSITWTSA